MFDNFEFGPDNLKIVSYLFVIVKLRGTTPLFKVCLTAFVYKFFTNVYIYSGNNASILDAFALHSAELVLIREMNEK